MFNNVLFSESRSDRLRDHDNAAGIGNNSAEISDGTALISDIAVNVIPY